ncbi:MAG: SprT family zinc-dependent metalloprotease [Gallionellaceae bacterium]|nr:SprT family zinc-dependent metalloprotease [Gallionellaceae bacterium]
MFKKLRRIANPTVVEQRTVELIGTPVTYTLKRTSRRRSIGLRVDDRGLTVNVPLHSSEKWLHSVLQERAGWVVEKLATWQAKKPVQQQWVDGEAILFRGETFTLYIVPSLFDTPPQIHDNRLIVHASRIDNPATIAEIVEQWYRREAMKLFTECVEHFAPLMNVIPREIKLSAARTQWGSCTTSGTVRLNWQLIKMPLYLIDYVVVHELAHLVEMNHSAAFWRVVGEVCQDYMKMRGELRKWSPSTE